MGNSGSKCDLSPQIFGNSLILDTICSFLDSKTLTTVQEISHEFQEASKRTLCRRKAIDHHLITVGGWSKRIMNRYESFDAAMGYLPKLANSWTKPSFALLMSSRGETDQTQEFAQKVMQELPASCTKINIVGNGVIGSETSDTTRTTTVADYIGCSQFSLVTLSENLGIEIKFFASDSSFKQLPKDDMKGILLFSIFPYLERFRNNFKQLSKFLSSNKNRIAIGGVFVYAIHITSGIGPNFKVQNKNHLGICFSGSHLKMASCVLPVNKNALKPALEQFKNSLDFDPDVQDKNDRTIGLIFEQCGQAMCLGSFEVDTMVEVFPGVRFSGSYGFDTIGKDFWPKGGEPQGLNEFARYEGKNWWQTMGCNLVLMNIKM